MIPWQFWLKPFALHPPDSKNPPSTVFFEIIFVK